MEVRVVRSAKRRKTISATLEEGVLVVRLPARLTRAQEREWVEKMRARFEKRHLVEAPETPIQRRAEWLNRRFFGGELQFALEWVDNQKTRWGSCSPDTGRIRLSSQLSRFPSYVVDYVIVHELAHLIEANHGPRFWALVQRYPLAEKAIGFLHGYQWARHSGNLDVNLPIYRADEPEPEAPSLLG